MKMGRIWGGVAAGLVLAVLVLPGRSQQHYEQALMVGGVQLRTDMGMSPQMAAAVHRKRAEKLVADMDRLASLTEELKAEVNKGTQDTLSATSVAKTKEIEKLARSVRDGLVN